MKDIKKIVRSNDAFEILDNSNCAGSDWGAGGCAILAQALNKLKGHPLYVIYNNSFESAEHFGVKTPRGTFLDHDGEHYSEDDWIRFFIDNEKPRGGELSVVPYDESIDIEGIEFDDKASFELAELIKSHEAIRESVRRVIKESSIWYHGTPDVRELEQEGGFTQKYISVGYIKDVDAWKEVQSKMSEVRVSDKDEYFRLLDIAGSLQGNMKIRKPVFLTNVRSVADSYANKPSFDYQNSEKKVLKVRVEEGKFAVINAPGSRFRFINTDNVIKGFVDYGANADDVDKLISQFVYSHDSSKGIRTDVIAAIGDVLGFDYIDVTGVLDSYEGGSIRSTVRMVFDPNRISIVKNDVLKEFGNFIKESFKSINESNEPLRTFEWDIAKEKLDKARREVNTKDKAKEYLSSFLDKTKSLPSSIKLRLTKYVVASVVSLLGAVTINQMVHEKAPEIRQKIATTLAVEKEEEKVVHETPTSVSDSLIDFLKHEEGSAKRKGEPVLKAYKLGDGMITVGWGHAERINNSQFKKGDEITYEEAEDLLTKDIEEAKGGLDRLLSRWDDQGVEYEIDQGKYDAMVSMIFNMGIGNFLKSNFIKLVKSGNYDEAASEILTTNVTYPGHVTRRQKEKEMFDSSMSFSDSLTMNEVRSFVRKTLRESVIEEVIEGSFEAYHGTDAEISSFTDDFVGGEGAHDAQGAGIYFATNMKDSGYYGNNIYKVRISGRFLDRSASEKNVKPRELVKLIKMKKDWQDDAYNFSENPNAGAHKAAEMAIKYSSDEAEAFQSIEADFYRYDSVDYVRNMTKLGYDGLIVDAPSGVSGDKHVIVFNPGSIEFLEKVK